jgi:hypothetical protein
MHLTAYDIVYRAIILGGAMTGLLYWNRLSAAFRLLALFLLYTFISESAALYMAFTKSFNYNVFKVYLLVQIGLWGGIYYYLLTNKRIKQLILALSAALWLLSCIYILSLPEKKMPIIMIDVESVSLIFFSIAYFYFLVRYPTEDNILDLPGFWLSSSVLIYNCGSFIYMASFNFLANTGITKITLNNMHNGLNIFHYGVLGYAMLLQVKRR